MKFETTLRYKNLNDRNLIESDPKYYDSVLIQAHLLAYSRKAVPQLLSEMANDQGFTYYIDPMISDFRIGNNFRDDEGNIRGWHRIYVDILGDPLETVLERRSNANARELSDDILREITRSIVDYQENFVYDRLEADVGKYEDLTITPRDVQPKAVIPWVHRIEKVEDIEIARKIINYAEQESTLPLKPCLYTTTRFIGDATKKRLLIELLEEFDVSECFLLFEDLNKYETTQSEYTNLIEYVYDIHKSGVKPHFYYGDFFSNLLAYFGLRGTSFSSLFDEEFKEKTEYSGGGGLPGRYYVDQLKDFLKIDATVDVMNRAGAPTCSCDVCERHFDDWYDLVDYDQDEDQVLKPILKKHRVAMRWNHSRLVEEHRLEDVLQSIDDDFSSFVGPYRTSPHVSPRKNMQYLQKWKKAVESRSELAVEELDQLQYA
ncbi:hypothetical protein [Natrononativus amylolyticus]|uniref:hypothetical protein n=1 Tax=Natrononativus amylolyticus TaxID=2963434 RepID=UPI0020CE08FA|nr:hypothetical protein [Natrononativus amylolyticus]